MYYAFQKIIFSWDIIFEKWQEIFSEKVLILLENTDYFWKKQIY